MWILLLSRWDFGAVSRQPLPLISNCFLLFLIIKNKVYERITKSWTKFLSTWFFVRYFSASVRICLLLDRVAFTRIQQKFAHLNFFFKKNTPPYLCICIDLNDDHYPFSLLSLSLAAVVVVAVIRAPTPILCPFINGMSWII